MTRAAALARCARQHRQERVERLLALGWTEVSSHRCPRSLAGKKCRNGYDYGSCWCLNQLNDHAATYTDDGGRRFVLWEPYGAGGEQLAELTATARQDGLSVWITSSVWNPPWTVGIRIARGGCA